MLTVYYCERLNNHVNQMMHVRERGGQPTPLGDTQCLVIPAFTIMLVVVKPGLFLPIFPEGFTGNIYSFVQVAQIYQVRMGVVIRRPSANGPRRRG